MSHRKLESLELKISKFLRAGVVTSGAFMLASWAAQLTCNRGADPFARFQAYAPYPLAEHLHLIVAGHDTASLVGYAGLAILISLPMIRVALTALLFLKQRDWILAGVSLFVLVALAVSFSLGVVE